jgi:hypothetical protein
MGYAARSILLVLLGLTSASLAAPSGSAPAPAGMQIDVTITSDSPPGWKPPEVLVLQAADQVDSYFKALDGGDYKAAYAMMTPDAHAQVPLAGFSDDAAKFNALAGHLRSRKITMSTWSKDPPGAPAPGIYAVFELAAQFTNVDRQCGDVVLYQPPQGGAFKVQASESNYLDNATAQQIELSQSHDALVQTWAKLSAGCPNYAASATP